MTQTMDEWQAKSLGIINEFMTWRKAGITEYSYSEVRYVPNCKHYDTADHKEVGFWNGNVLWTEVGLNEKNNNDMVCP